MGLQQWTATSWPRLGGDITVNSDIFYGSGSELILLAMGDVIFNASVQNRGNGAINLIAGWDGTTAF
jgi:hypothetical protein